MAREDFGMRIAGWGAAPGEIVVTNEEIVDGLVYLPDFTGEKTTVEDIVRLTGIHERRITSAEIEDPLANLGVKAGRLALEKHNLDPKSIGLLINATTTPDYALPATAHRIQGLLGLENAVSFDLNAACAGLVVGILAAEGLMKTMDIKRAAVVGGDRLSALNDYTDRNTGMLFADGSAIIIIEQSDDGSIIFGRSMKSKDKLKDLYAPHFTISQSRRGVEVKRGPIIMNGRAVFSAGVRYMIDTTLEVMEQGDIGPDEVDLYIPHQANDRMTDHVVEGTEIPEDRVVRTIRRYGNCSSGTIGIALDEHLQKHNLMPGDHWIFSAAGAGFTGGALGGVVGERGIG